MTIRNAGNDIEKQELSFAPSRNTKWKKKPTLEDNLAVACTIKLPLTQYGNCATWYLTEWSEKNLYTIVMASYS